VESEYKRRRAIRGLAEFLRRRSFPRLALGLVLALTGLAGFGFSFFLLNAGLGAMWLRYPIAVLGGIEQRQINPEDPEVLEALEKGAPEPLRTQSSNSWLDWLDLPNVDIFDADGCLPVILIGVVIALVAMVIVALIGAPFCWPKS
jgi:hypothetical protein